MYIASIESNLLIKIDNMPTYIPVYQKKINVDTNEAVLDANGCVIMEHVRDLIVPDPPTPIVLDLTPEELESLNSEILLNQSIYGV
jgi:hypothetical protein